MSYVYKQIKVKFKNDTISRNRRRKPEVCGWVAKTYSPSTNCLSFDSWLWVWKNIKSLRPVVPPLTKNQRRISLSLVEWWYLDHGSKKGTEGGSNMLFINNLFCFFNLPKKFNWILYLQKRKHTKYMKIFHTFHNL